MERGGCSTARAKWLLWGDPRHTLRGCNRVTAPSAASPLHGEREDRAGAQGIEPASLTPGLTARLPQGGESGALCCDMGTAAPAATGPLTPRQSRADRHFEVTEGSIQRNPEISVPRGRAVPVARSAWAVMRFLRPAWRFPEREQSHVTVSV